MPFKVGLKYCGCCNPQADMSQLSLRLTRAAGEYGLEITSGSSADGLIDIQIILCGCPRACVDKPGSTNIPGFAIIAVGENRFRVNRARCRLPSEMQAELFNAISGLLSTTVGEGRYDSPANS